MVSKLFLVRLPEPVLSGEANEHPLLMEYGPVPGWVILLLLFGVSGGFFLYQVVKASRLSSKGSLRTGSTTGVLDFRGPHRGLVKRKS